MNSWIRPVREQMTLERTKRKAFGLLVATGLFFASFMYLCVHAYQEGPMGIDAHPTFSQKRVALPDYEEYSYSENTRTLWYKPQSFQEALILFSFGRQTILHPVIYLLIAIIVFVTMRRVSIERTFSIRLFNAFYWIACLLLMLPMANSFFKMLVVNKYLKSVTQGRFTLDHEVWNLNEMLGPALILYLLYFIKHGIQLQDEQALTV